MEEQKIYDVTVRLTEDSPDTEEEVLKSPLSHRDGPVRGPYVNMCPTFRRLEQIAVECGGGWEDWEPYRCTFNFDGEDGCDSFIKIAEHELNHILIEKFIWDWEE